MHGLLSLKTGILCGVVSEDTIVKCHSKVQSIYKPATIFHRHIMCCSYELGITGKPISEMMTAACLDTAFVKLLMETVTYDML